MATSARSNPGASAAAGARALLSDCAGGGGVRRKGGGFHGHGLRSSNEGPPSGRREPRPSLRLTSPARPGRREAETQACGAHCRDASVAGGPEWSLQDDLSYGPCARKPQAGRSPAVGNSCSPRDSDQASRRGRYGRGQDRREAAGAGAPPLRAGPALAMTVRGGKDPGGAALPLRPGGGRGWNGNRWSSTWSSSAAGLPA